MAKYPCENCSLRAKYSKSFIGKFWRWHINFCPGFNSYFKSVDENKKNELRQKYNFKK